MKTTDNDTVLKDVSFVWLSIRIEMQILLYYYMLIFGMASLTVQPLTSKMFKYLSPYMLRDSLNVQILLAKKSCVFILFPECC